MERIKVFLSDPQVLFREGIHFTLSGEEDFEVTGETTDNENALHFIEENPPHVAILNMRNGKLSGPEVTQRIKRNLPGVAVILVMDQDSDELLFLALKAGAGATINKDIDPDQLTAIIRDVAAGKQPIVEALLTSGVAPRILAEFEALSALSENINSLLAHPTPKELEILKALAERQTLEQIVARVGGTEADIIQQTTQIINKLVANEQARAMIEASQRSMPFAMTGAMKFNQSLDGYVTKTEFNEFKEGLMERLKSFIGEVA